MKTVQVLRDEVARLVLTATLNVEEDDERWLVGHMVVIPEVGQFLIAGAQIDSKVGKTITIIRDSLAKKESAV